MRRFRLAACAGLLVLPGCSALEAAPPRARTCALEPSLVTAAAGPVRWDDAAPPRDAPALARWCAAVGAPVLLPGPAAAHPDVSDRLVVVSWNVHVGGGDIRRLVEDLRAGRLTGGQPVGAFVLLLQEAYRSGSDLPAVVAGEGVPRRIAPTPPEGERRDVVATARELGLSLLYVPSMRNGRSAADGQTAEDRGNAILSSLPLADAVAVELPFESQRRVPVAATVAGRTQAGFAWRLRVVSAHLDTRGAWTRPVAMLGGARLEQARALAAALSQENPIVLGADLNTWSAARLERAVPFLRAQFPSSPPEVPGGTYPLPLGLMRPLDHLFLRVPDGWTATVRRGPSRYGSDHYPLVAQLVF